MTDPTDFTLSPVAMNDLNVESADDYAVNFPIEDGDDPRTVRGTGSTMVEAMEEAKELAATRRVELGLVEDGD